MFRPQTSTMAAALTAALLAVSACTTAPPAANSPSPASEQPTVNVYSGRSESLVKGAFEQFTAATGIKVNVRYGDTAQLAAQLIEEGDKTSTELFFAQDAGALGAVADKDLFRALPQATLDQVPAQYRDDDGDWIGITGRSRVLAYNRVLVPKAELPDSVFDLVKPEWKGKVGVAPTNASFQAFVTAIRVQHGEAKARDFLTRLKANDPQIREGNAVIVADIQAGKIAVGLVNHYYVFEKAKELGTTPDKLDAQLHFFGHRDTGALVNVAGVGLLAKQPDGDAQKLVDYLLSKPGQTYFSERTSEYPLIKGVKPAAWLPALNSLDAPKIDLSDLKELGQTIALIKEVGLL